jgi:hypothetical protein
VEIRLADAMDYLTRKDYADNWFSEMHEQFCGLEFADWKELLDRRRLRARPGLAATRNDWIVDTGSRRSRRCHDSTGPARLAGHARPPGGPPALNTS